MSELLALGISHKTAPVALRERLAFTAEEASKFSKLATATAEVREAVDRCGDDPALAEQATAARLKQSPLAMAVSHRVAPGARFPCRRWSALSPCCGC